MILSESILIPFYQVVIDLGILTNHPGDVFKVMKCGDLVKQTQPKSW